MITSRRNPLVRRLKSLVTRRGREEQQLLLLEGTHLLQEVLICLQRMGPIELEVVATTDWLDRHADLFDRLPPETVLHPVSEEVLSASITTINPDGVATLLPSAALPQPVARASLLLALDRLQDPGNLGSLFRSSLAAGVEGLWMASGADPLAPKVLRSSAGSVLHLPHQRFGPSEQDGVAKLATKLQEAVSQGMQVVATLVPNPDGFESTPPYWELDWLKPTVLVLGNEGAGIHPSLQACCTHCISLPHSKAVESLNVAAAAVPLLLERRRVKMTTPLQQSG